MGGHADTSLVGVAAGAVAVICCAGLPTIAGVLGGITLVAALGVAGGVLVVAGAAGASVLLFRVRRRRGCRDASGPSSGQ